MYFKFTLQICHLYSVECTDSFLYILFTAHLAICDWLSISVVAKRLSALASGIIWNTKLRERREIRPSLNVCSYFTVVL